MEKNSEHEPESIASLLGVEVFPPSADSSQYGKFSALRITGLFLALCVLVSFTYFSGGISGDGITVSTIVWVISVCLVPPLFLLMRYGKDFLAYVPASIAICFSQRATNVRHAEISATLGHLTFGIGLLTIVAGTALAAFFFPDPVKMNLFAVPAFWGAFFALVLFHLSLFLKHAFLSLELPSAKDGSSRGSAGLGSIFLGFAKLSLGFILITIVWFCGLLGFHYVLGELADVHMFLFLHNNALLPLFLSPILLLATFPDDFSYYLPKAIAAFFRKQKSNRAFVVISRVGGHFALFGAILSLTLPPICWWHRISSSKYWNPDFIDFFLDSQICGSLGALSLGFFLWAVFRYLQYAFSEKK